MEVAAKFKAFDLHIITWFWRCGFTGFSASHSNSFRGRRRGRPHSTKIEAARLRGREAVEPLLITAVAESSFRRGSWRNEKFPQL